MCDSSLGQTRRRLPAVLAIAAGLAVVGPVEARVTRIVIDATAAINNQPAYEQLIGRAFGEIDPANPQNALITDITDPVSYTHLTLPTNREV